MVTRSFLDRDNLRGVNSELLTTTNRVGGLILPVLGLSAVLGGLGGGFNEATSSGRAASSVMFQLRASTFGLQEVITRLLLPGLDATIPTLTRIIDLLVAADEATNSWSTRIGGVAGILAVLNRQRIGGVLSRLIYGPGAPAAAARGPGSGIGGGVASAGATVGFRGIGGQGAGAGGGAASRGTGGAGRAAAGRGITAAGALGALGTGAAVAGLGIEGRFVYQNRDQYVQTLRDIGLTAALGAVSVAPQAAPAIYNTFNITASDTDDLIRRIQGFMDNGAFRRD